VLINNQDSVDGFFEEAQVVNIIGTLEAINANSYFDGKASFG